MKEDIDEKLREAACYGDWEAIERMIANDKDIDINSQNKVNGWTALHWAAKRNHMKVVQVKYIVKLCLQSSYISQNSFHFDEFFRRLLQISLFSDVNGQWC